MPPTVTSRRRKRQRRQNPTVPPALLFSSILLPDLVSDFSWFCVLQTIGMSWAKHLPAALNIYSPSEVRGGGGGKRKKVKRKLLITPISWHTWCYFKV
jgi:hypothetical protein